MSPDPVVEKLTQFTPDSALVDPTALLFAAGRASARTPWCWKVAVAGLALGNAVCLTLLLWPATAPPHTAQPAVPTAAPPAPEATALPSDEPWSYRTLISAGDPERFPRPEVTSEPEPASRPLTVLSARRGDLD